MRWLNYHHLLYFWTVAREGSIARACEQLHLAQPTVSGQLRLLEQSLGSKLLERSGRGLALTDAGRRVYRYADAIFTLGRELQDDLAGRPADRPLRFAVGVGESLPKLLVHRLLAPALALPGSVHLVCHEGRPAELLGRLAAHELDLVLADAPAPPTVKVRAFNHALGECGVAFFAAGALARRLARGFPRSLDGAALLLPTDDTALRRSLEAWFDAEGVRPRVAGEFSDSALLKAFGQLGSAAFPAPAAVADEVRRQYRVRLVGVTEQVRERFYAISVERQLKHPAVRAISDAARQRLFA